MINIKIDSRKVTPGDTFVALKGATVDGHDFIEKAIEAGATKIVAEKEIDCDVETLIVGNTNEWLTNYISENYSKEINEMNIIGVTGTNGKTTTAYLTYQILNALGSKTAYIGTIGFYQPDKEFIELPNTTPNILDLYELFLSAKENGCKNVMMEVRSHALPQERVKGIKYKGAAFTNLTQDHLDYHITMRNYFKAKAILFENLKEGTFAVINADDEYAKDFINIIPKGVNVLTSGVKNDADIKAENIDFSVDGAKLTIKFADKEEKMNLHLNGMFSVYNALAAFAGALAMGVDYKVIISALEQTKSVAGRFEIVCKKPLIIVDYAHTPDGLENVLKAAREITPATSNLICLFGCGGDRDTTKRPKMGKIADELSDKVVVTSDNPRSEDPQIIISDIMTGIKTVDTKRIFVEIDRGNAIKFLKSISNPEDVIVLAGKGHEDYQILKDETIHFDDREEAKKVFASIN